MLFFIFGLRHSADAQSVPVGVSFGEEILRESIRGDNWCTTWAADGHQYTSMCDGLGWDKTRTHEIHTEVLKISGSFENVFGTATSGYPVDFNFLDETNRYLPFFFGFGIVDIDGHLYQFLSRQNATNFMPPFQGISIIHSPDAGQTWYNHRGENVSNTNPDYAAGSQFFWQEDGFSREGKTGYAFSWISVCQMGMGHRSGEQDGFVYLYSPNGANANELNLARVPEKSITDREAYQFFKSMSAAGDVRWTKDLEQRGVMHQFPKQNSQGQAFGWYSWLPSVVWNEGLKMYIMVNGGTYSTKDYWDKGHDLHRKSGSLALYYAKKPWGPWTEFYQIDHWYPSGDLNERTYQPKLSPKWISKDGTEMVLIWSDAAYSWGKEEDKPNYYKWNQMKIKLILANAE